MQINYLKNLHICDFCRTFALGMIQLPLWLIIVLIYWAGINIVTFFLYGIDKWKAKRSKWRIKESTLLWWAALGGTIGDLLGMKAWHHKTMHKKFRYGVPAILIAQIAIIVAIIYYILSTK